MLAALRIPSLKYFFLAISLTIVFMLGLVVVPGLRSSPLAGLFAAMGMLVAMYPAARTIGFEIQKVKEYLSGLRGEFGRALCYFILLEVLLYGANLVYSISLAPWDLEWTNKLLFWNSQSSNPSTGAARLLELAAKPLLIPWYLLGICVIAPVTEEFLFRRWLYIGMRSKMPVFIAILLNGALFGLIHERDFFATGICGIAFCWTYEKTGKLETPVLMHGFINLFAVIYAFWGRS